MENISPAVIILFMLTTIYTVVQFYFATGRSKNFLGIVTAWMALLTAFGISGFYRVETATPPRFLFLITPAMLVMLLLFATRNGRLFMDSLSLKVMTRLHIARIPVEITLYYLYLAHLVPELMTFEGNNYDIFSGISDAVVYHIVFVSKKAGVKLLLIWNFIGLCLLLNILLIAILSARTPFQKFAFEQPNIGVTYFPFVWLAGVVVPLVLLSHLAAIRQLILAMKRIQTHGPVDNNHRIPINA